MMKGQRLLLGVITLPPAIYFPIFYATRMGDMFSIDINSPELSQWTLLLVAFHFLMFLYTGLLWAFYMILLFGDKRLDRDKKLFWAILLVVFSVFAMPLYWFFHLRKEEE